MSIYPTGILLLLIINNNLHLYSANFYMNIFGCPLQYCYIKFMLKVTKAWETIKNYNKSIKNCKKLQ